MAFPVLLILVALPINLFLFARYADLWQLLIGMGLVIAFVALLSISAVTAVLRGPRAAQLTYLVIFLWFVVWPLLLGWYLNNNEPPAPLLIGFLLLWTVVLHPFASFVAFYSWNGNLPFAFPLALVFYVPLAQWMLVDAERRLTESERVAAKAKEQRQLRLLVLGWLVFTGLSTFCLAQMLISLFRDFRG